LNTRESLATDKPVVLLLIFGVVALSLFLQQEFSTKQASLFLIGIGLGVTLLHAAFGFSGSWRTFLRERRSEGIRAQLLMLVLTSLLFFPVLGEMFPALHVNAALAPVGISVLVGAFLFGLGMQFGGGCGSGTLFTIGGGHVRMLIVLAFFIVGATIGSVHLPAWTSLPNTGNISLIQELGWLPALLLQIIVLAVLFILVRNFEKKRHGNIHKLGDASSGKNFVDQLIFGPWPLWWAIIGLAVLNFLTLLIAGHAWTITFAFGLWGTKIWAAIGGDISTWTYWQGTYASNALNSSILADTTSLMDFGIIIGAMLAAALAGKFAPDSKIDRSGLLTAIAGGLLMGYGARLAFGCNIGGLVAGISTGSVHGWLWLVSGFTGNIVGVWLRVMLKIDKPLEA
jgi:uncharacterized membrane protein YedE/YeeE